MALFTVVTGVTALIAFDRLRLGLDEISSDAVPTLVVASQIARETESIIANAPALVGVATHFERQTLNGRVVDQVRALDSLLGTLDVPESYQARLVALKSQRDDLVDVLRGLDQTVEHRIRVDEGMELATGQIMGTVETIRREMSRVRDRRSAAQAKVQVDLRLWAESLGDALLLTAAAVSARNEMTLQRTQTKADQALQTAWAALESLPADAAVPLALIHSQAVGLISGESGVFALRARQVQLSRAEKGGLAQAKNSSSRFLATTTSLLNALQEDVSNRSAVLQQYSRTNSLVLLVIVGICIAGSVGFFVIVHRVVLQRLTALKDVMDERVAGWPAPIPTDGADEISDMAKALQYFVDALEKREEAMRAAKDSAEAGARAKSEFLAVMSHEIRTPMNGILGMNQLLMGTEVSLEQRQYLETIDGSGRALLTVLDDILDFSKIEAGRIEFEQIDFDLHKVIDEVAMLMKPRAREKNLFLDAIIAASVPRYLKGDEGRLRQVLFNLVGNAVKFTESGSVTIKVDATWLDGRSSRLLFEVIDTGMGIGEKARSKLFRSFSQADSSISRQYGGTGLGLAVCKKLIDMQGGVIDVVSQEGSGSRFWFELTYANGKEPERGAARYSPHTPVAIAPLGGPAKALPPSAPDREPVPAATPAAAQNLTLLVAEDNVVNGKLVTAFLEKRGHKVKLVSDGHQALKEVSAQSYDAVLMDVQMPGMDGLEATKAIRSLSGAVANIPIIALTAGVFPEDIERCRQAGMDDFVAKPIDPVALFAAIDQAYVFAASLAPGES